MLLCICVYVYVSVHWLSDIQHLVEVTYSEPVTNVSQVNHVNF